MEKETFGDLIINGKLIETDGAVDDVNTLPRLVSRITVKKVAENKEVIDNFLLHNSIENTAKFEYTNEYGIKIMLEKAYFAKTKEGEESMIFSVYNN